MSCFDGLSICVTGAMMSGDRNEIINLIRSHGGSWSSTVTTKTDVLVANPNELNPPTRKVG